MTETLVVRGLTKAYRGRTVVDGLDLEVSAGQTVGLLGPNGAGKTTTFEMILGLRTQDSGTVGFGRCLDRMPLHRRAALGLGYLPQGPSVFRGLSARENLLVLLESLKTPAPSRRADELLERFGLVRLADQKARTLSGGERRRLEFARALCSNPKILLVDEPFAGVDPLAVAGISLAVEDMAARGVGVLLTDHTVREALSVCDRVYVLVDGRIVERGTPDEVRSSEVARRLYLGEDFS